MESNQGRGQTTYNIVPNGDFEFGSTPLCYDHSYIPILIEEKIDFWKSAKGTPDWMDVSLCLSSLNIGNTYPDYLTINHFPSNRLIRLGHEAIRVGIQYLTPGKKYILRIKIAPATPNHWNPENNQQIKVLLTKFSQHWASDPNWFGGGNIKEEIATFNIHGNISPVNFQWHHREITFTAPTTADQLGNLIILCSKGTVFIDDVELFEICSENLIFENTTFSYKEPVYESDKYIFAGYDISNPPAGVGKVVAKEQSDVKFKAGKAIIFEHGFEAQNGSDFEAWIEPCDGWDSPTNFKKLCVRPGECLSIGGNYNPIFNYSWSPSIYLNSPHIPNPIACLPNSGFGTTIYTLTITDDIGNQIGMPIEVELSYYPSTPMYGLSITNHPLSNEASIFWYCDLSFQYNTEKIVVLINNNTGTIKEYEMNAGSDWAYPNNSTNINLHFSTEPDFFQPGPYFINIGYKIFCDDQWVFNIGYIFNHQIGGLLSSDSLFCTNDTIFFDNFHFYLNSLSSPLNEGINELSFLWDFGDGNTANTVFQKKVYPNEGTYLVSLQVHDGLIFNESIYQNFYINDCIENNKALQIPNTYTQINESYLLLINPNPFLDNIDIHFNVLIEEQVKISLYDVFGNCVAEIINNEMPMGRHSVSFSDNSLPTGMFFCVMETPSGRKVVKVVKNE